ncbi:MAG: hypothetical protein U1A72_16915 [Sulfuritalea sp.]|nr:hypothetical protein [Sulfuritalea sp.]
MTARLAYDRALIGTAAVAGRLGMTPENFSKRRKLLRSLGFPEPVLPRRWDPLAIERWLDARMPEALQPEPPETIERADAAAELERRGALIARGIDPDALSSTDDDSRADQARRGGSSVVRDQQAGDPLPGHQGTVASGQLSSPATQKEHP